MLTHVMLTHVNGGGGLLNPWGSRANAATGKRNSARAWNLPHLECGNPHTAARILVECIVPVKRAVRQTCRGKTPIQASVESAD
jgi:hypothetical protein